MKLRASDGILIMSMPGFACSVASAILHARGRYTTGVWFWCGVAVLWMGCYFWALLRRINKK